MEGCCEKMINYETVKIGKIMHDMKVLDTVAPV